MAGKASAAASVSLFTRRRCRGEGRRSELATKGTVVGLSDVRPREMNAEDAEYAEKRREVNGNIRHGHLGARSASGDLVRRAGRHSYMCAPRCFDPGNGKSFVLAFLSVLQRIQRPQRPRLERRAEPNPHAVRRADPTAEMPITCSGSAPWPFMNLHALHVDGLALRPAHRCDPADPPNPADPAAPRRYCQSGRTGPPTADDLPPLKFFTGLHGPPPALHASAADLPRRAEPSRKNGKATGTPAVPVAPDPNAQPQPATALISFADSLTTRCAASPGIWS